MPRTTRDDKLPIEVQERQLALVDRIIGLEAEIAQLKASFGADAYRSDLQAIKSSTTWRVGRIVLAPVSVIKRAVRPLKK